MTERRWASSHGGIRSTPGERTFDLFNALILIALTAACMLPILHVVAGSFSSSDALIKNKVSLWPVDFTLDNFRYVAKTPQFWNASWMTAKVVVIGTLINMILTIITSYPLSKMNLRGRKFFMLIVVFTIIFQVPMIPLYLVVKDLDMLNTMWALVIPNALSAFNMLLCITFFRNLPEELFDAARVDGMNEYRIVWSIVVPLSMPIIVTLILFYAVGHWNNYMMPLLYVNDRDQQTLTLYIYNILTQGTTNDITGAAAAETSGNVLPRALEMATVVLATAPIVILYPFLQKHFIKGATLGSIKE